MEALQAGVLQVFMITTGGFGAVYGPAQALDLPYFFDGDAIAECVLDGPITDKLSQAVRDEEIAIRLMTVSNTGGWRNFATTESPIHAPEDVEGRKIRTITAPLQQEFMRQLGMATQRRSPGPRSTPHSPPASSPARRTAFTTSSACSCMNRFAS